MLYPVRHGTRRAKQARHEPNGKKRTIDETGNAVDTSGTTLSGAKVDGLPGLRKLLLAQPEQFPRTVTKKLLAYALGRRLEYYDRPAVRKIVRDAAAHDYHWSALIMGIVESPAFLMRASVSTSGTARAVPDGEQQR